MKGRGAPRLEQQQRLPYRDSDAAGRKVEYRNLPEAAYRDALIGAGVPADFAAALAEYSAKAGSGILADGSRTLSGLLGHPTATLRATILRTIGRAAPSANAR